MATSKIKATLQATKNISTPQNLFTWNKWLAVLHAVQGIAVLLLSDTRLFPVQTSYLTNDSLASNESASSVLATASHTLFDLNLAYLVASFFFLSALAHAVMAFVARKRYEADLQKGLNRFRWYEYGLSASIMMVAIAVLSGVVELSLLITLFSLTLVMNLTGLAMEIYNRGKDKPNWLVYIIGCIAGIVPWIVVALYLWGANMYGVGGVPTFVYWVFGTMFVLFSAFAVNMYLQYKKIGPWKNYLYGERMYMILSLVAKSALAWQVYAGTLRP